MPNGYQITQQREPIGLNGFLDFIVYDEHLHRKETQFSPYMKRCNLKQIQLEQDSGKSLVDEEDNQNLIDLNRAGVALVEFVFEPELHSVWEATSLVRELILLLQSIQVCSCKMEEGALRVDANISIRKSSDPPGQLGTRTEVKNLNSIRFMREAIDYEIQKQIDLLDNGQSIINETLGFDFRSKSTFMMRDKEIVQDYRFLPEPNLPAIFLKNSSFEGENVDGSIDIAVIRDELPRLPRDERNEFRLKHKLNMKQIFILMNDRSMNELFHEIYFYSTRKNGEEIFHFLFDTISNKLFVRDYRDPNETLSSLTFSTLVDEVCSEYLSQLCDMLYQRQISESTVLDVIKLYHQKQDKSLSPQEIVDQFGWTLIQDEDKLEEACRMVIQMVPKIAAKYAKNGFRRPNSMLIQRAQAILGNQVDENKLWDVYDKILRTKTES